MGYAYLGEATTDEFKEIHKAFPAIVGIDVDDDDNIVLGVSKELSDQAIGMYQLIVSLWNADEDTKHAVWDVIM